MTVPEAAPADPSAAAGERSDGDAGDGAAPGELEELTQAFVDSLPYAEGDPRRLLGAIAVKLAARVDKEGAVPAAVRELRTMLVQLVEAPNGPAGPVDEGRLRRAQRRFDALLAQMLG